MADKPKNGEVENLDIEGMSDRAVLEVLLEAVQELAEAVQELRETVLDRSLNDYEDEDERFR